MEVLMRDNFYSLPDNLPVPQDDGGCSHLENRPLPDISLKTTGNRTVNLAHMGLEPTVLFFYPRTGRPDESAPVGWDKIPGARGCTPQSCGYRDIYGEFLKRRIKVFGVSTRTTKFQQEFVQRVHLPFEILSDSELALIKTLRLPTFEFRGMTLLKRMAWYCNQGKIVKVFYPVFPPDKNAETVLKWVASS